MAVGVEQLAANGAVGVPRRVHVRLTGLAGAAAVDVGHRGRVGPVVAEPVAEPPARVGEEVLSPRNAQVLRSPEADQYAPFFPVSGVTRWQKSRPKGRYRPEGCVELSRAQLGPTVDAIGSAALPLPGRPLSPLRYGSPPDLTP